MARETGGGAMSAAAGTFCVTAWAAWAPEREAKAGWHAWASGNTLPAAGDAEIVPPPVLLRRRITPVGQQALRAAWQLPDAAHARLVFCSRDGEFSRTVSILSALDQIGEVSPADFTLSVHHALAGLLSIAHRNHAGHTTLAAGTDSFAAGLQEAIACLAENPAEPVVLVHFHEPLPPPFDGFDGGERPFALALTLSASGGDPIVLRTEPLGDGQKPAPALGMAFLRFLLSGNQQVSVPGERVIWHWRRLHAPT